MAPFQRKRATSADEARGSQHQSKKSRKSQSSRGESWRGEQSNHVSLHGQNIHGVEFEFIDLTQADDELELEFYGLLDTKIVGVRYYSGYASPGENVLMRREPSNPYDANAIRIDNVYGNQIGHIPKVVAAKLAPYLDNGDLAIEAILTGEKQVFDCPVRLHFYGTSAARERRQLEARLRQDKLLKATQLNQTRVENEAARKSMGLTSGRRTAGLPWDERSQQLQPSLEELTQISQVHFRSSTDFIKSIAMSEDDLATMPMATQPSTLKATLLPYQLQGLAWLMAKESPRFPERGSEDSVQLWKHDVKGRYVNLATNYATPEKPRLLSGGILADDMGLGKTLQTISLIMTNGHDTGPTLIVAPVSVMRNWEQQIHRHVLEEHLPKVHIYHGSGREAKPETLKKYDVIITSYGTVTSENKEKAKGPLFKVEWRRIVLDEGHTIRNANAKMTVATCALQAKSKWVLTGTPIINSVRDLHSLLVFLGIKGGIEIREVFTSVIARPLAQGQERAESLLQALMKDLCLRRKKDMKVVDLKLPPKTEYTHTIEFWPDEKKKYEALLMEAKGALEDYQKRAVGSKGSVTHVLERLLRLRQICDHWVLCKTRVDDLLSFLEATGTVELTAENLKLLQQGLQLAIESQDECPVCLDSYKGPVITPCKHVFCRLCVTRVMETQGKCPLCRSALSMENGGQLIEPAPEAHGEEVKVDMDKASSETSSSKTEALSNIVAATLKKKGSKIIIFSQWTSFLNVIQHRLDDQGYKYTRIDGSMSAHHRDAALKALDEDPDTRILLASLSVCSVGLNLVAADTVILADSWWAPAIEDQAVDRVHRLGQTRPTTVWRLVVEGTVEERVLEIQAKKRELVTKAFQDKEAGRKVKAKETRMADILKLLS